MRNAEMLAHLQVRGYSDRMLLQRGELYVTKITMFPKERGASMAMHQHYNDDRGNGFMIHLFPELRRRIRIAAAQSNLSVQEYVVHVLDQTVPSEAEPEQERSGKLNRAAVDKLLQTREAIIQAHPGQIFEDSSELIHRAHEERNRELEQE